jgi:hypothetical protein
MSPKEIASLLSEDIHENNGLRRDLMGSKFERKLDEALGQEHPDLPSNLKARAADMKAKAESSHVPVSYVHPNTVSMITVFPDGVKTYWSHDAGELILRRVDGDLVKYGHNDREEDWDPQDRHIWRRISQVKQGGEDWPMLDMSRAQIREWNNSFRAFD